MCYVCPLAALRRAKGLMPEKLIFVGLMPDVIVLDPGDEAVWLCNAGMLRIEFDPHRCPFTSNILQTPEGVQLASGPIRRGVNSGSYSYRVILNDVPAGVGEIIIREKQK
jgi:hypothetical protein